MYKFLYDYAIPKWGVDKIKVGFTDTDSFLISIETEDAYEDIKPDVPNMFDTSDYPKDNKFGIEPQNKKVSGIMSDEMGDQILTEFIGAGPKNYRFEYINHEGVLCQKGGCKGVPGHVVPNMNSYWNNLYCRPGSTQEVEFFRLGSKDHIMYSKRIKKVALRNITSKRFDSKDDFYDTVPFGYYEMLEKHTGK